MKYGQSYSTHEPDGTRVRVEVVTEGEPDGAAKAHRRYSEEVRRLFADKPAHVSPVFPLADTRARE